MPEAAGLSFSDLFDVGGEPTLSSAPLVDLGPAAIAALNTYLNVSAANFVDSTLARYTIERFGISADVARSSG